MKNITYKDIITLIILVLNVFLFFNNFFVFINFYGFEGDVFILSLLILFFAVNRFYFSHNNNSSLLKFKKYKTPGLKNYKATIFGLSHRTTQIIVLFSEAMLILSTVEIYHDNFNLFGNYCNIVFILSLFVVIFCLFFSKNEKNK